MSCEIEKQAEDLKDTNGRIDVIKLANDLGIKVFSTAKINVPSFIAHDREANRYEIYVNSKEKLTRQRFSIAHEIAHYVKHKNKIMEFGIVGRQNDYSLTAQEEQEADSLAGAMLMPKRCVNDFLEKKQVYIDSKIDLKIIQKVAAEFETSLSAVIVRLRELGYYVEYIELG